MKTLRTLGLAALLTGSILAGCAGTTKKVERLINLLRNQTAKEPLLRNQTAEEPGQYSMQTSGPGITFDDTNNIFTVRDGDRRTVFIDSERNGYGILDTLKIKGRGGSYSGDGSQIYSGDQITPDMQREYEEQINRLLADPYVKKIMNDAQHSQEKIK